MINTITQCMHSINHSKSRIKFLRFVILSVWFFPVKYIAENCTFSRKPYKLKREARPLIFKGLRLYPCFILWKCTTLSKLRIFGNYFESTYFKTVLMQSKKRSSFERLSLFKLLNFDQIVEIRGFQTPL
jgi:hypothetical protein